MGVGDSVQWVRVSDGCGCLMGMGGSVSWV